MTLRAGLAYLRRVVAAPVPERSIRELRSLRPLLLERAEFRAQRIQPRQRSAIQWGIIYHEQYLRRELSLRSRPTRVGVLQLAARRLGVEHVRDLRHALAGGPPGRGRPASEMAAAVGRGVGEASRRPIGLGELIDFGEAEL